ncbi:MAG: TonB-dependent receptor [Pseudomonadales bacterium]|nr:TonB-dependent receptor [Pseudomonadales bacterium]
MNFPDAQIKRIENLSTRIEQNTFPRIPLWQAINRLMRGTLTYGAIIGVSGLSYVQAEETISIWGTTVQASSINLAQETIAIRQADHVSDLLRTIPGVDVGGAHSLNQRITIRSMDDKDLRISIDGANQNTYMYHHMGNLQIHADILQSVDIEIGNNSVINGGLGGVVRFETKDANQLLRPGQQFGGRAQVSYADNASKGFSLTGYGQFNDQFDVLGYYNGVSRDNFEVGGGKIKGYDGATVPGTNGEVVGLKGDLSDALLKLGWDISGNQRLELGYEYYEDEGNYSYRPDMGLATDVAIGDGLGLPLTYPTEFTRDTMRVGYELQWGLQNQLKATLFNNVSELWRDESAIHALWPTDPATVEGTATNTGLNVLATSRFGSEFSNTLNYGIDIIRYETEYRADGTERSSEEALSAAVFIEDRVDLGYGIAVTPGIRYDNYDIDSTVIDDRFQQVSAALALEYAATDSVLLSASTTQLFKGPEIGEVFTGAGLYDTANPDIDAETGLNTELSAAYEDSVLGADRFAAGITLFQTDINDYIYDYATPPADVNARSWKDNVGDMQIRGYEAYLGYDIGQLRALLTYSVAESDLEAFTQYAQFEGARLDRQQGDTITMNLDYNLPALDLALHWDMSWVDDVDADLDLDGATKDNSKDGYVVHNISAQWSPKQVQGVTLTLGVDNLFDKFYASQSSRTGLSQHPRFGDLYLLDYEPGRNIKMTVSYQL